MHTCKSEPLPKYRGNQEGLVITHQIDLSRSVKVLRPKNRHLFTYHQTQQRWLTHPPCTHKQNTKSHFWQLSVHTLQSKDCMHVVIGPPSGRVNCFAAADSACRRALPSLGSHQGRPFPELSTLVCSNWASKKASHMG